MEEPNNNVKNNKLTDKAFSRLAVTSILGILFCIVCLCSTTYAWFTASVPSLGNELKTAGECSLEITVSPYNPDGPALTGIEDGVELEAGREYLVVMLLPPNSASGYCMIEAGGNTYYSEYIVGNTDIPQIKSFILKVETSQTVTFDTRWGIYTRESDVVNGVMTITDQSLFAETETPADESDPTETNENISE